MSVTLCLDHKRRIERDLADQLRARLSARFDVPEEAILLSPTPGALSLVGLDDRDARPVGPDSSPVCALVGQSFTEPQRALERALSETSLRAALDALTPAGEAALVHDRNRSRVALKAAASAFAAWPEVQTAETNGSTLTLTPHDADALRRRLAAMGIAAAGSSGGDVCLIVSRAVDAEALAMRLGTPMGRRASARRTTNETDIAVSVDLDRDGPVSVSTGIEFFDHMLDQVARHGGFALDVTATGDLGVDAHHTIEDVCLAIGEALRTALSDKRGIARFGFELPMDETRAGVWIDLSGRPFARFEGTIPGERVARFPVEMTAHAFRSFAEAMKASIHVKVDGENAHHMIEACFKSFGRALRQAIRVEGRAIPSTKGAL